MFDCSATPDTLTLTFTDNLRAEIYLFGGLLNRYEIKLSDGIWFNTVKGFDSPQHARGKLTDWFNSAKLSPFACRIRNSSYRFQNRQYRCGKHAIAGHAAHGLMYDALFRIVSTHADQHSAHALLRADYTGTDSGFPFPYRLDICYTLSAEGLRIQTDITNLSEHPMPLADGWHPYFTLGGQTDDWTLTLNSTQRLCFDQDLVPDGTYIPDTRFQTAYPLNAIELDNCFPLSGKTAPACTLTGKQLSLSIYAEENYPYLQIFTPPMRDSIAIETLSGAPDCFNNGIGLLTLNPGEKQSFQNRYLLRRRP